MGAPGAPWDPLGAHGTLGGVLGTYNLCWRQAGPQGQCAMYATTGMIGTYIAIRSMSTLRSLSPPPPSRLGGFPLRGRPMRAGCTGSCMFLLVVLFNLYHRDTPESNRLRASVHTGGQEIERVPSQKPTASSGARVISTLPRGITNYLH